MFLPKVFLSVYNKQPLALCPFQSCAVDAEYFRIAGVPILCRSYLVDCSLYWRVWVFRIGRIGYWFFLLQWVFLIIEEVCRCDQRSVEGREQCRGRVVV